jgi:hypothetical protein
MIEYISPGRQEQSLKDGELWQMYRNVFGTAEGRVVLGDILRMCHFGVPLNTEEERYEYNVGVAIVRMSGIMSAVDSLIGLN